MFTFIRDTSELVSIDYTIYLVQPMSKKTMGYLELWFCVKNNGGGFMTKGDDRKGRKRRYAVGVCICMEGLCNYFYLSSHLLFSIVRHGYTADSKVSRDVK